MIAEGLTTVQYLIWVTDDCWEDFLRKSNNYKVKSRDIYLLRTIASWMRNNEQRENNKVLPEQFDISYLGCFQRHPRKSHYRHPSKPEEAGVGTIIPHPLDKTM